MIYSFIGAGLASWFHPKQGDSAAVCAMNTVRSGSVVYIVRDSPRRYATCMVVGTGPFVDGRIIDVSPSVATTLGFLDSGVTAVRVYVRHGRLSHPSRVQPITLPIP